MKTLILLCAILWPVFVWSEDVGYIRCRATSEPNMTGPAARPLKCGEQVTVLGRDETGMWVRVRTADNRVGQVSTSYVSDKKSGEQQVVIPESLQHRFSIPRVVSGPVTTGSQSKTPEATRAGESSPTQTTPVAPGPAIELQQEGVQASPTTTPHPSAPVVPQEVQQFMPVRVGNATYPLEVKVLQTESMPWNQQILGPSSNTNCAITGTVSSYGNAWRLGQFVNWREQSYPDLRLSCQTYSSPGAYWRHVLNTMLVVASDGNAYMVSCNRSVPWSKCQPLRAGSLFPARWNKGKLAILYGTEKGKGQETSYQVDASKALRP